jgi:hypothetical protein
LDAGTQEELEIFRTRDSDDDDDEEEKWNEAHSSEETAAYTHTAPGTNVEIAQEPAQQAADVGVGGGGVEEDQCSKGGAEEDKGAKEKRLRALLLSNKAMNRANTGDSRCKGGPNEHGGHVDLTKEGKGGLEQPPARKLDGYSEGTAPAPAGQVASGASDTETYMNSGTKLDNIQGAYLAENLQDKCSSGKHSGEDGEALSRNEREELVLLRAEVAALREENATLKEQNEMLWCDRERERERARARERERERDAKRVQCTTMHNVTCFESVCGTRACVCNIHIQALNTHQHTHKHTHTHTCGTHICVTHTHLCHSLTRVNSLVCASLCLSVCASVAV